MAEAEKRKDINYVLRTPQCQTVCVNMAKVRWHKLEDQKSLIVKMQEKDVRSVCYRGKETNCICYDAEEKHR